MSSPSVTNKPKCRRRGSASCSPMKPLPLHTYKVGVYFPDRDVLNFIVKCHDFKLSTCASIASFYLVGELGIKELTARFTHVAYILLQAEECDFRDLDPSANSANV